MAVTVGETPPQPLHPPAESHLLRCVTAALCTGQHSVAQHRGGQEIQVQECVFVVSVFVKFNIATSSDLFPHLNVILCCSPQAVSRISSLNGETVAAGVVTCLIVYPLYLLVFTVFRMSRSKVTQTCLKLQYCITRSRFQLFP